MIIKMKAYAKINLLLDILGTLENGYHDLFMLMQSVSLHDVVEIEETNDGKIQICCDKEGVPCDETNIAYKAAKAFFEYTGLENKGIKITLEKNIPHAAGLAGGSADGAAVVNGLKNMYLPNLNDRDVIAISSMFGSDVPFCATGGTMIAQGTGTVLTYMPQLDIPYVIITKPYCSVSTGPAYKAFDTAENVHHSDRNGMFYAAMNKDYDKIFGKVSNTFEQFIDVPQRVDIKAVMRKHGAVCSCMSGSGPSVFGIFADKESAESALEDLKKDFPESFLCSSVEFGTEII